MIAFVQPFGLHARGGGPRILRSLLGDAPVPYLSVCTAPQAPESSGPDEVHLPIRPYVGRVEHTRIGPYLKLGYVSLALKSRFKRQLRRLFLDRGVTAVHAIPHGIDFWFAFEVARELGIPYVVNVHDDLPYNLPNAVYLDHALNRLGVVWRQASRRIVISEAMGTEYNQRYGRRTFEVITDGLRRVPPVPRPSTPDRLHLYFMGSVHLTYRDNFQTLIKALNVVREQRPNLTVQLTIRGGVPFPLKFGDVSHQLLGWGTQSEIEQDLDDADLLYFPLPFASEHESFVRYSLSTKMVTYLGSGVPVLYHGPEEAAAARLLNTHGAGILAPTTSSVRLAKTLSSIEPSRLNTVTRNALQLAEQQFMLRDQRERFWSVLGVNRSVSQAGVPSHSCG